MGFARRVASPLFRREGLQGRDPTSTSSRLSQPADRLPLPPLDNRFWPVNGICNLDPMLETYVLSGDEEVLRNALAVNETDAFQKTVEEWNGGKFGGRKHAVIVYENIRVPSLLHIAQGAEPFGGVRIDLVLLVRKTGRASYLTKPAIHFATQTIGHIRLPINDVLTLQGVFP